MGEGFGHEQLHVYQRAISFVALAGNVCASLPGAGVLRDQLERAAESIPLNIVEGNSRWTLNERNRYLDIAYGSCLECASCLDVAIAKSLLHVDHATANKAAIIEIVRPLIGLRRAGSHVRETSEEYATSNTAAPAPYFSHERLTVYIAALEFVTWCHRHCVTLTLPARHQEQLDRATISIPLNIAEGSGRYAILDHRHFLDLARRSALRAATLLDIIATHQQTSGHSAQDGKEILRQIVAMLLAMKKSTERVMPNAVE